MKFEVHLDIRAAADNRVVIEFMHATVLHFLPDERLDVGKQLRFGDAVFKGVHAADKKAFAVGKNKAQCMKKCAVEETGVPCAWYVLKIPFGCAHLEFLARVRAGSCELTF